MTPIEFEFVLYGDLIVGGYSGRMLGEGTVTGRGTRASTSAGTVGPRVAASTGTWVSPSVGGNMLV